MTPTTENITEIQYHSFPNNETLSCRFIAPSERDGDTAVFETDGLRTLNEYLEYVNEDDFIYLSYCLAKAIQDFRVFAQKEYVICLDRSSIFFDDDSDRWLFVPSEDEYKFNSLKNFYLEMVFGAVFDDKKLKSVRELFDFVRLSTSITEQDIIMMIEMAQHGSEIKKRYSSSFSSHVSDTVSQELPGSSAGVTKPTPAPAAVSPVPEASPSADTFGDMDDFLFEGLDMTGGSGFVTENKPQKTENKPIKTVEKPVIHVYPEPVKYEKEETAPEHEKPVSDPAPEETTGESDSLDEVLQDDSFSEEPVHQPEVKQQEEIYVPEPEKPRKNNTESAGSAATGAAGKGIADRGPVVRPKKTEKFILIDSAGNFIQINKDRFILGRNKRMCDCAVANQSVSRQHAEIIIDGDTCCVADLHSTNKTKLNGSVLTPGEYYVLEDGDIISLGIEDFAFRILEE